MIRRAAIAIGINRSGSMTVLQAAVKGAEQFAEWATRQRCDTTLLTDGAKRVSVTDIFDAVKAIVDKLTYDQLIIYFSGHGILQAPGAEFWLLSGAPDNPNEAVNLSRSSENARNAGIPHIVFISDACRSSVPGPPLSAVTGGVIFPTRPVPAVSAEIDIYYGTRPGDPAYEVPEADATQGFRGIFTDCLLDAVGQSSQSLIETVPDGAGVRAVISSRKLKDHLEPTVPIKAAAVNIQLKQRPQLRVESALPKFFADCGALSGGVAPPRPTGQRGTSPTFSVALESMAETRFYRRAQVTVQGTEAAALGAEVTELTAMKGRSHFETRTGFTVHGAKITGYDVLGWNVDPPFEEPNLLGAIHLRFSPETGIRRPASAVLEFDGESGTYLPVLDGFIGTVVVRERRVVSVTYTPSDQNYRYHDYAVHAHEIDEMRSYAAVASRHGSFMVANESASQLAARIRQGKGIDPTLGLYAAYAYAQVGSFKDVYSVFEYMQNDEIELPIPFDVVMLASRFRADVLTQPQVRFAPFAPMLGQGWALLQPGDPMHRDLHERIRPHLIPSLWTTLAPEGVSVAREALRGGID